MPAPCSAAKLGFHTPALGKSSLRAYLAEAIAWWEAVGETGQARPAQALLAKGAATNMTSSFQPVTGAVTAAAQG